MRRKLAGILGALMVLTMGLLLSVSAARAQVVTASASPASFRNIGDEITITYRLDPSPYHLTGPVTATSLIGEAPITCGDSDGMNIVECTGTYLISDMNDMSGEAVEMASFQAPRRGGPDINLQSQLIRISKTGGGMTTLSVKAIPDVVEPGDRVILEATLSSMGCNGGVLPPGIIVLFTRGSEVYAGVAVPVMIGGVQTGQSKATVNLPAGVIGPHSISASYAGGLGCAASSATGTYTVRPAPIELDVTLEAGSTPGYSVIKAQVRNPGTTTYIFSPVFSISDANGPLTVTSHVSDANSSTITFAHGTGKRISVVLPTGFVTTSEGRTNPNVVSLQFDLPSPLSFTLDNSPLSYGETLSRMGQGSGGTGSYSYSAPGLPAGITLNALTGELSGRVTFVGHYNFSVTVTDSANNTSTAFLSGTVATPEISLSDDGLGGLTVNTPMTKVLTASGGIAPYKFNVTSGLLPAGLTLSQDGLVTGIPTAAGTYDVTITASDAGGMTGSRRYTGSIAAGPLLMTLPSTASSDVKKPFSMNVGASGGTPPYSYGMISTPSWLTIGPDGTLSGTPTAPGTYDATARVTDSADVTVSRTIRITVNQTVPDIADVTMSVEANSPGNLVRLLNAGGELTGNGSANYIEQVRPSHGAILIGRVGQISYAPNPGYVGTDTFTLVPRNTAGSGRPFTVSITVKAPALTLGPETLAPAFQGKNYSLQLTAASGEAPYTFDVTDGLLPPGISLNGNGLLSGTPTAQNTYAFTVKATDKNGFTGTRNMTMTVGAPAPIAGPASLTVLMNSGANPVALNVSGGTPTSFTIVDPPAHGTTGVGGLSVTYQPNSGYSGPDSFTYLASNAAGPSAPATVTVTVTRPVVDISPTVLPDSTVGLPYDIPLIASGGTADYSFAVTGGAFPDGVDLGSDGVISGTPAVAGRFTVTVTASDANGAPGSRDYDFTIYPVAPIVADSTLILAANSGATAVPLDLTGGAADRLLLLDPPAHGTATVNGTTISYHPDPGYSGPDSLRYQAANDGGLSATALVTITVDPPQLALTPSTLSAGQVGVAYAAQFSATLGTAPYSYLVTAGALPDGLQLGADGALSGTPTTAGQASFTVEVTDALGATGSQALMLDIIIDAPTASASTLTVAANSGATAVPLVLSGGVADRLILLGQPPHGTATVTGTTISYQPRPGYSGPDSFSYQAENAGGLSAPALVSVTVDPPQLKVGPASLASGVVGESYSAQFTADRGASPYHFAPAAGGLPNGLTLAADGRLSGTPTGKGSYVFTVIATDANGATGSQSLSLEIVDQAVAAVDQQVTIEAGSSTIIDLSQGAQGGVTGARILAIEPVSAARAELITRQASFARSAAAPASVLLRLTISDSFEGTGRVIFVLTGAGGDSAPAAITFNVARAVDPLASGDAYALASSHNAAARRLASSNMDMIHGHMRRMRQSNCLENALNLSLTGPGSDYRSGQNASLSRAACGDRAVGLWLDGGISFGKWDNSSFAEELSHTTRNLTVGMDFRVSEKVTGGLALSYGRDVTEIGDLGSKSRNRSYGLTAYATWDLGQDYYVDGLIGLARLDFDTRRWIAGEAAFADGQRSGEQAMFSLAAGRVFINGSRETDGYLRISGSRSRLDAFTETGAAGALRYEAQTVDSLVAAIGASTSFTQKLPQGLLTSRFSGELNHDFADEGMIAVSYATSGSRFERKAAQENSTGLRLGAAFDLEQHNGWRIGADLGARFDRDGFSGGDMKLRWLLEF